jgi:hypothetical protein
LNKVNDHSNARKGLSPDQGDSAGDGLDFDPEELDAEINGQGNPPANEADAEPDPPPAGATGRINFDELALADDYEAELAASADQTTVVVKKACGVSFFRAHPEKWKSLWMLEIKNGADRGFYLVGGAALKLLRGLVEQKATSLRPFPARLTLCYGRDVGPFLWPLKLPQPRKANQQDEWSATAQRICKMAETQWIEMFCPAGASCYHWNSGTGITGEPSWPSLTLEELAGIAFEGKYLTNPDDPVLRRQLGKE